MHINASSRGTATKGAMAIYRPMAGICGQEGRKLVVNGRVI